MSDTQTRRIAFALAALFALCCVAINPVGYVGGGADDEQYLAAARCWVAQRVPCLPESHWWTRWPAFAPSAAGSALLGEGRWSIGLGPLAMWAAALALLGFVVTRWFGWRAGALSIALLAATPVFTAFALAPNTDIPELAFQLGALAAATLAFDRQSRGWAVAGGLLAGLALQARDTSVLFLGAAALAWLTLDQDRRRILLWAVAGLAGVMLVEVAAYALATGDPLLRYELALGHTRILSNALPEGFDTSASPILNPAYIKAWEREAGVTIWWPLDPWLNLLANPRIQSLLGLWLVAMLAFRKRMSVQQRRSGVRLLGAAGLVALLLVYGLAVDPKARMFLPLAAALAAVSAALVVAAWRSGSQLLAGLLVALHLMFGLNVLRHYFASRPAEQRAETWLRQLGNSTEIDEGARSYLTLLPIARRLPTRGSGQRFVIMLSAGPCAALVGRDATGRSDGRVVDQVGGPDLSQGQLCLFEYAPAG